GFDFIRIGGSIVKLIQNRGDIAQGGSTITQQVYKNITGRFEQTFERKIQEVYNAVLLEMKYDKKQIITMYANLVNMGNGCYGYQSASKMYFGKTLDEINLSEAAILAAITNSPGTYDPYGNEEKIRKLMFRREDVLDKMLELGYIDQREYDEALAYEIVFAEKVEYVSSSITSYFLDYVITEAIDILSTQNSISELQAERIIYNNGLHIYTTLVPHVQDSLDTIFTDDSYFAQYREDGSIINIDAIRYGEKPQGAMVIIDQYTGGIAGLYGGNGEKTGSRTYNRATGMQRQPGSTFKPLAVYGPALDLKLITASTIIDDAPAYLDPKNPDLIYPTNYDSTDYQGLTTIRNAIKASVNVVAAKVWSYYLGRDNSVEYLEAVGIHRSEFIYDDSTVSTAIGGLAVGVSPLEMASAFSTFANKGIHMDSHSITKITNNSKETIFRWQNTYTVAYSEQSAAILTNMLEEVVKPTTTTYWINGTAYGAVNIQNGQIAVAGKTGTTSDYLDKWFCGYTPYYTASVWYGYDNKSAPVSLVSDEYGRALKLWNSVMNLVHENLEPKQFIMPSAGIVTREVCIYSGKLASELCTKDPRGTKTVITEYFIEGTEPTEECDTHQEVVVCAYPNNKDEYGRFYLASDDCPSSYVWAMVRLVRPDGAFYKVNEETFSVEVDGKTIWQFERVPYDVVHEVDMDMVCPLHYKEEEEELDDTEVTPVAEVTADPEPSESNEPAN
ncbi:MAG: penicillin-binding protein, partial [Clostridiaceae bacterium]|nr:penicillin-binding protein [Clostridiaceae bacterium]